MTGPVVSDAVADPVGFVLAVADLREKRAMPYLEQCWRSVGSDWVVVETEGCSCGVSGEVAALYGPGVPDRNRRMSALPLHEIACDGDSCDRARTDYGTAADVRRNAREYEGWLVGQPGGKDYCAACRPTCRAGTTAP